MPFRLALEHSVAHAIISARNYLSLPGRCPEQAFGYSGAPPQFGQKCHLRSGRFHLYSFCSNKTTCWKTTIWISLKIFENSTDFLDIIAHVEMLSGPDLHPSIAPFTMLFWKDTGAGYRPGV